MDREQSKKTAPTVFAQKSVYMSQVGQVFAYMPLVTLLQVIYRSSSDMSNRGLLLGSQPKGVLT